MSNLNPSAIVFRSMLRSNLTMIAEHAAGGNPQAVIQAWADTAVPTDSQQNREFPGRQFTIAP